MQVAREKISVVIRLCIEGRRFGSGKFIVDQERDTKETICIRKVK
jgi:hypothetical protein